MRTIALLTWVAFTPSLFAEDTGAKDVEAAIRALNDSFKTGDAAKIKALMADDHKAVTPWGGSQTRDEQIKTLSDLKLETYETGPLTVTMLGSDGALVTYALKQRGTFNGKELPAHSQASAVWVRRAGKWQELHYQETAITRK